MALKTFTLQFEDGSPESISYELEETERLRTDIQEGVPFVYANRAGMLALAKILVKLSMGTYSDGFHVHLRSDFSGDAGQPDAITLVLDESLGESS